jgi:hypothetical protein
MVFGCSRDVNDFNTTAVTDSSDSPLQPGIGVPGIPDPNKTIPTGLLINDANASRGYTLIAPLTSTNTYLIDMESRIVHAWGSDSTPALGATLLDNGNLLRPCVPRNAKAAFTQSGGGGCVQEFTWNGELIWDFRYCDDRRLPHHDVLKLPNGNVLLIVCERILVQEALAAGRRPDTFEGDYLLSDCIVEIKPTGRTTGEVVWEWRVWDHLVQESDSTKPNFGKVADHPELIDVNYGAGTSNPVLAQGAEVAKLQALGYVSGPSGATQAKLTNADWTHVNSVAYNPKLDQIVLTSVGFNEIWIIDHSTTKAEAVGHTGGKYGKGGDVLYRWGNPRTYRRGTSADQRLFGAHHAHWIEPGLPGEGNLLIFNNGVARPGMLSSVEELVLPVDASGRYGRETNCPFGPDKAVWSYDDRKTANFHSSVFSGAQRLPNGNTLACLGAPGTILEITQEGEAVWKYTVPGPDGPLFPGDPSPPSIPLPVHLPPAPPGQMPPHLAVTTFGHSLFRAPRYAPDHPGLVGKDLTPKTKR